MVDYLQQISSISVIFLRSEINTDGTVQTSRERDGQGENIRLPLQHSLRPPVRLGRQTTALVNLADRRLIVGVVNCYKRSANGGLSRLHSADEDAVSWLTNYGSCAHEKKKNGVRRSEPVVHSLNVRCVNDVSRRGGGQAIFSQCDSLVFIARHRALAYWRAILI